MTYKKNQSTWVDNIVTERQVIPRWHSPLFAAATGERNISIKERVWSQRALGWQKELSKTAELEPTPENIRAAEETNFIINGVSPKGGHYEVAASQVHASTITSENTKTNDQIKNRDKKIPTPGRSEIAKIRSALRTYPNQTNLWSELARNFTITGQDEKARNAMCCALALSPNSTYIRRSASRMYVHMGDSKQALKILRSHPAVRCQPHMVAAEIAITSSQGRASNLIKTGRTLLENGDYSPAQISELAAAIGTNDLNNGKHKKSRQLFQQALINPNENVVAQAQWANQIDERITISDSNFLIPTAYEARTLKARLDQDWDCVHTNVVSWLDDEMYSTRPASLGSFLCFSHEQNKFSDELATVALISTPNDPTLLNNRSVARSYLGMVDDSLSDIQKALRSAEGKENPTLLATLGLLAHRSNDQDLGDLCYGSAIKWFVGNNQKLSAILASLFWLRELSRTNPVLATAEIGYLKRLIKRTVTKESQPEINSMIKHIEHLLSAGGSVEFDCYADFKSNNDLYNVLDLFSIPSLSVGALPNSLGRVLS